MLPDKLNSPGGVGRVGPVVVLQRKAVGVIDESLGSQKSKRRLSNTDQPKCRRLARADRAWLVGK